jgi:mannosyltransferase OCH1-like enzyme
MVRQTRLIILDLYIDKNEAKLEQAIKESMRDQLVSLYLLKEQHPEEKVLEDMKTGKSLNISKHRRQKHIRMARLFQIPIHKPIPTKIHQTSSSRTRNPFHLLRSKRQNRLHMSIRKRTKRTKSNSSRTQNWPVRQQLPQRPGYDIPHYPE